MTEVEVFGSVAAAWRTLTRASHLMTNTRADDRLSALPTPGFGGPPAALGQMAFREAWKCKAKTNQWSAIGHKIRIRLWREGSMLAPSHDTAVYNPCIRGTSGINSNLIACDRVFR
ncbi:hypothetical protein A0H81_02109 [Grifola frondosa]|uniref:Uncharacterized protein n=1 Tax=Grifola frondosa TaxID=5627 RepID=A0A1C7MLE6_GRIFR|nr:hypothetical protein A0H81_02109 [Grifola frondosa]